MLLKLLHWLIQMLLVSQMHCDNGSEFRNGLETRLVKALGIIRIFMTHYYPHACRLVHLYLHTMTLNVYHNFVLALYT